MATDKKKIANAKRKKRIRAKIAGTSEVPRLTVYKSQKHIYAQAIDDANGTTIAYVCTTGKKIKEQINIVKTGNAEISFPDSAVIGEMIAEEIKKKGISTIVFDRNGYRYHGKVKALAEAVRRKGVTF